MQLLAKLFDPNRQLAVFLFLIGMTTVTFIAVNNFRIPVFRTISEMQRAGIRYIYDSDLSNSTTNVFLVTKEKLVQPGNGNSTVGNASAKESIPSKSSSTVLSSSTTTTSTVGSTTTTSTTTVSTTTTSSTTTIKSTSTTSTVGSTTTSTTGSTATPHTTKASSKSIFGSAFNKIKNLFGGGEIAMTTRESPNLSLTTVAPSEPTLITLITTFKNSEAKKYIYKNTIVNWALLKPYVRPVYYYMAGSDLETKTLCEQHGWETAEIPKVSAQKIPVLRTMVLDAEKRWESTFYGYANGDILFNTGLIDNFKLLATMKDKLSKSLIVGRRSNLKLKEKQEIKSLQEVTNLSKAAKLFGTNAEDYFISVKGGYPWDKIPDFVVGRVGYDNWLVVHAIRQDLKVIDLTKTLLALHQTGVDGDFAGHRKKSTGDTYINYGLAGKSFDYSLGHVTCGQFESREENGKLTIVARTKNVCERTYRRYKKNPYGMTLKR